MQLAGKSPVLLVGTDGSMTSSADLTAAGGAWVAIGIMDDKDLHDEDTTAWTQRLQTRPDEATCDAMSCALRIFVLAPSSSL